jgi:hypothetical protein
MSTPKKKPARKAKPAKKPAARPIPPPPPGWEIVGKDDPRWDNLPETPIFWDTEERKWEESGYDAGEYLPETLRNTGRYALPIAQPAQASPPMIRLRLPSEKPTGQDADDFGDIVVLEADRCYAFKWYQPFASTVIAWLPGCLPDGILPREPSQEEKWRAEFEEEWSRSGGSYSGTVKSDMWKFFLATKKGGAE